MLRVSDTGLMDKALAVVLLATACSSGSVPANGVEIPGPAGQPGKTGATGPQGPAGAPGAQGAPGPGVLRPTLVDSTGQVIPVPYIDSAGFIWAYDAVTGQPAPDRNITVFHEGTTCTGNKWVSIPTPPNLSGIPFDYTKVMYAPLEPASPGAYYDFPPSALLVPPQTTLAAGSYSYMVFVPVPGESDGDGAAYNAVCKPFPIPVWVVQGVPTPHYARFEDSLGTYSPATPTLKPVPPMHYEMR
jgi:hypothetical protein